MRFCSTMCIDRSQYTPTTNCENDRKYHNFWRRGCCNNSPVSWSDSIVIHSTILILQLNYHILFRNTHMCRYRLVLGSRQNWQISPSTLFANCKCWHWCCAKNDFTRNITFCVTIGLMSLTDSASFLISNFDVQIFK